MPDPRALLLAVALAGPAAAGGPDAAALERLLTQDCGSCHGLALKGGLGPDLRADTLAGWSAEALAAVILDGRPGTAMPPWRPLLTEAEADWLARRLLTGETP
jgi:cytochrome c55X